VIPSLRIRRAAVAAVPLALALASGAVGAQSGRLTPPEAHFGHPIGADYVLPDYRQLSDYWRRLAAESDRMRLVDIGRTAEGRTQYMAIVTSPDNHRRLQRLREVSATLAAGRADSATAHALAAEGRAVVWIDGGLHATEVLGAQQLVETVWQLVSRDDPETLRILDDVVVLAVHANPDGMDLVSEWYMRSPRPEGRSTAFLPRLYQKYIGHDNNRDFFASTQPETENMNRVLYHEWFPQIVYNHHQTSPTGTVMFAPPFRDPFNYLYDPLIVTGIDLVGAAMHNRFVAEGKPGVTMRRGANYSTWWNGGLRTTTYFHNMIGLLTETMGSPTPTDIPFVPNRQLPSTDLPAPIAPQRWHFRQSVDYSVTANYAVLDYASRYRQTLLTNVWRMGRNAIERGSRDHWTPYPRRIDQVRREMERERGRRADADGVMTVGGFVSDPPTPGESARALALLRRPEWRDPRGYVIPREQRDFPTAVKFVNALRETGVTVHRATGDFRVAGRSYPRGSLVVRADQPFRAHVLDMFEPQDHPDDFRYEGGPPVPPYDNAGWTLAYQMGVHFDRILEPFDGPFEEVSDWNLAPPPSRVVAPRWAPAGYLFSPRQNDAFTALNRLLAGGIPVFRVTEGDDRARPGDFWAGVDGGGMARLRGLADSLGLVLEPTPRAPAGLAPARAPRIGLWDRYGGSMPSGWTRWILERFGFPFEVVYANALDAGNLNARFDVLVFVTGAIPEGDRPGGSMAGMPDPAAIPTEFHDRLGTVTLERTLPRIREFLESGGTVVTIGSSTVLARHLGLPVESHLTTVADGGTRPLRREEFYVPGSVLRVAVDTMAAVARGMPAAADVMFDSSPVFRLGPSAPEAGVRAVAWFDSPAPLRSGWAWGQHHLEGGVAVATASVGRGTLHLFGPEILFRAQPHGTFRLFFNALHGGAAVEPAPAR
jgi:hypothetical protein